MNYVEILIDALYNEIARKYDAENATYSADLRKRDIDYLYEEAAKRLANFVVFGDL